MNPIRPRKVGHWWAWYCRIPRCGDFSGAAYRAPGTAADAGRAHLHLWHTHGDATT